MFSPNMKLHVRQEHYESVIKSVKGVKYIKCLEKKIPQMEEQTAKILVQLYRQLDQDQSEIHSN